MTGPSSQHGPATDHACPGERPGQRSAPQKPGTTRLTATVSLPAAARTLGIPVSDTRDLAEAGRFPCQVIRTEGGCRVPFGALVRVLRIRLRLGSGSGSWPPDSDKSSLP
jgi:hypothetical protein